MRQPNYGIGEMSDDLKQFIIFKNSSLTFARNVNISEIERENLNIFEPHWQHNLCLQWTMRNYAKERDRNTDDDDNYDGKLIPSELLAGLVVQSFVKREKAHDEIR